MASAIGSLTVSLGLDAAEFSKGLTKAEAEAKAKSEAIASSFSKAGVAIGAALAAGVTIAIDAITSKVKDALEAVDAFNDLKDATGSSIENISAIDRVARETGTGFETVSTALIKLNQALSNTSADSPAAAALARIGLSAQELRSIDPAEALRQIAVALSQFADDGNKARLVQELFGKSLKDVAPLLNDLAEKNELIGKTSTEGAAEVEKFRKEIFQLQANSQDTARSLTVDLVTNINLLLKTVREGKVDIVGFHQELAKVAITALSFGGIKFRDEADQNYGNEGRRSQNPNFDYSNEGRSRRSVGDPKPPDPKVRAARKEAAKEYDQQVKDYLAWQKLIADALADSVKANEQQVQQQERVLQGFQDEAKDAREAAAAFGLSKDETEKLTSAKLREAATSLEVLAIHKEEKDDTSSLAYLYREQAKALRETADAKDLLASKQSRLENDPFVGATQAVKDYLEQISNAGIATSQVVGEALKSVEDIGVDVLSGKSIKQKAKALVDSLIAEFVRLAIVRPLLQSLVGASGGGGGGFNFAGIIGTIGAFASGSRNSNYSNEGRSLTGNGPSFGKASSGGVSKPGVTNNLYSPPGMMIESATPNGSGGVDIKIVQKLVDSRVRKSVAPGGGARQALKVGPPDRS